MAIRTAEPRTVETRTDRVALVNAAGMPRVSLVSVLAGTLVAYGAFAVLLAIAAAVAESSGLDVNLTTDEWRDLGAAGGAVVAGVLFLCYLFGGYVAGRMARRAGATHGFLVVVLGVALAVGVGALVALFTDGDEIVRRLRDVGVPTSGDEWRDIGTVAGLGSLLAMVAGSLLGGALGERWHAKLLARSLDPDVGPEAEARIEAERRRRELREAEERAAALAERRRSEDPDVDLRDGDGEGEGDGNGERRFTAVPDEVHTGHAGLDLDPDAAASRRFGARSSRRHSHSRR